MKTIIALTLCILAAGCTNSNASKEKLLRKALADTNVALSESQARAAKYQKAYERLVHEKVKAHRQARKHK